MNGANGHAGGEGDEDEFDRAFEEIPDEDLAGLMAGEAGMVVEPAH